ncbi:MAG: PHB depolymerase family esterase, partial [Pseudomonadota bacterium]
MNHSSLLQSLMAKATSLTRSGNLSGATAAIQAALQRAIGAAVPPETPADAAPQAPRRAAPPADVIDGLAREVPTAAKAPAAAPTAAPATASAFASTSAQAPAASAAAGSAFRPAPDTGSPRSAPSHATDIPEPGSFIRARHSEAAGARDYKLFVPPQQAGRALPLVVMLHGCTQNPDDFAQGTAMNDLALAQGFFVLYPEQSAQANGHRCWNWFKQGDQQRGAGEPAVLAGMTRAVMKQHNIDPRRVYVAGLSAGGAMAAILGDAYPDLFAAIGVHSGLATGAATDVGSAFAAMKGGSMSHGGGGLPGGLGGGLAASFRLPGQAAVAPAPRLGSAPPTIVFHGDADKTVSPLNGEQVLAACLPSSGASTALQAGQERRRSDNGREYTRRWHQDSAGRTVAEHWVVHGAGHAWSGGQSQGSYTDPKGPDASAEMLRFFLDNPAR